MNFKDPAEPPSGGESRTPLLKARGQDVRALAEAVEALFSMLVPLAFDNDELQVQLSDFRDEFHPRLERIMRTYRK